jgi:Txe/YoeB family toxin of toxin-antitoxin system
VNWKVILSKKAVKDSKELKSAGLKFQTEKLLYLLSEDPFHIPPDYEKLVGNLKGFYSRRINIRHRLVYDIEKKERIVHVLRVWTHYE